MESPTNFQNLKIGILGGGQLGLMMQQAAMDFHLEPTFLDPDPLAPVAPYGKLEVGSFRDYETVLNFGRKKDLISIEIEDVNLQALLELEEMGKRIFPQPSVLSIIKNKGNQKNFLKGIGLPTSDFLPYTKGDFIDTTHWLPAFWKQEEGGYDGKGVIRVNEPSKLEHLPPAPGFLEKKVAVKKELSVIVSRNERGELATFPAIEMVFDPRANLVSYLQSPAEISKEHEKLCKELAKECIEGLDMIGLLAVEFFLDEENKIWINEMAPRPHNSGHHTIEGSQTSQFQQFWRSILGWPPANTKPNHPFSGMVNLIGEPGFSGKPIYAGIEKVLAMPGVYPHIYGKTATRPFRKMGHVTVVADSLADLQQKVSFVQNQFKVIA